MIGTSASRDDQLKFQVLALDLRKTSDEVILLLPGSTLHLGAATGRSADALNNLLGDAGYKVVTAASSEEALKAVRAGSTALVILGNASNDAVNDGLNNGSDADREGGRSALTNLLVAELKDGGTSNAVRVLVLGGSSEERGRLLSLGADAALPSSIEPQELLANVRAQLRAYREIADLRGKARLAEQGQEIAHTAFNALAVTEKMARDATSLDKRLKIGVAAALAVAAVMAAIFFLFSRSANKEAKLASAALTQLERGMIRQGNFVGEARALREEMRRFEQAGASPQTQALQKQTQDLRAKIAGGNTSDVSQLQQQLAENNMRLRRIENESNSAQQVIRSQSPSVCLLHVAVAFRDKASGQMLHYAGLNSKGEPLADSDGKTIFMLGGNGPEVRADFFGSGFVAGEGGRILTNHHVVEPWWKNEDLNSVTQENMEPVISRINAYFPGERHAIRVEIQKISQTADLAVVQQAVGALNRPALQLDTRESAARSGEPLVSVGYATGLSAILARADEDTMASIVKSTGGNTSEVMAELARRDLIRPLTTQGHIGDVLSDKIVFDAATTSGGSGGPLFNQDGKVIGVTFAVVRGFGGSNFGIPIRFAVPLLKP